MVNDYDGMDYWPCYDPTGKYIYFISDRQLNDENVYRIPAAGGTPERLTDFTDRPVHWLSSAKTGRLAFTRGFHLWVMDPGEKPRMVNLQCATEPKHRQEQRLDIGGFITEMKLSPDGTHVAVISRGDLYIIPWHDPDDTAPVGDVRYGKAIRVTDTPSRERYVAWHPDGDRVALVSDKDGNNEIYEINLRTFEWKRLTNTPEDEYYPQYSHNGKSLSYFHGNGELAGQKSRNRQGKCSCERSIGRFPRHGELARWSPDDRWIGSGRRSRRRAV